MNAVGASSLRGVANFVVPHDTDDLPLRILWVVAAEVHPQRISAGKILCHKRTIHQSAICVGSVGRIEKAAR